MKGRVFAVALFTIAASVMAVRADDEAWKREMERKLDVLTQELEKRSLGDVAAEPVYKKTHGLAPAASKVYHVNRGVSIGGYGEMVYQNFASQNDAGVSAGRKDELDFLRAILYVGHKFHRESGAWRPGRPAASPGRYHQ